MLQGRCFSTNMKTLCSYNNRISSTFMSSGLQFRIFERKIRIYRVLVCLRLNNFSDTVFLAFGNTQPRVFRIVVRFLFFAILFAFSMSKQIALLISCESFMRYTTKQSRKNSLLNQHFFFYQNCFVLSNLLPVQRAIFPCREINQFIWRSLSGSQMPNALRGR